MKIESSTPGNNTHSTLGSTPSTPGSTPGSTPSSTKGSTTGSTASGQTQKCVVEWDKNNVVATQLEGTWVLNKELTSVLYPSHSPRFSKIK